MGGGRATFYNMRMSVVLERWGLALSVAFLILRTTLIDSCNKQWLCNLGGRVKSIQSDYKGFFY